jgi:DNA-binding transcriptional MocR family regulator
VLSDNLGVTIGTISRAYGELERLGLVVARVGDGTFVRKRGMERQRDEGFRNFSEEPRQYFDMSRNMHIPGQETTFLAQSFQTLSTNASFPGHQCLHPGRRPAALPRCGRAVAGAARFSSDSRAGHLRRLAASMACSAR